ncbi:ADP-ribosyl-(dinitrogen reductase) hydrolase [Actinobacillus equuli]|uniref:ADP-ribosyl-(dinitrogen reductase) hydrolase n=1 Tax=Actinobacillus equuli TaxID=718 RepID=UPI002443446E|nr:ADP-ribosyl-(dinitrogen reductase) hydrolase [Actinobacillus equuli]WGE61647.1 ADP-ribosyl-(dinitrogen reductase) hydrolase [Actinobacillus equuli subsp. haemolyticus]
MLIISHQIYLKLIQKHGLSDPETEILEAFSNINGRFLIDTREEHLSEPPTEWFIAETNRGIKLKICFIRKNNDIYIRTAYHPSAEEIRIYEKYK